MRLEYYQIQQIQNYLDSQGIWYIDVKEEVLDHVISSVEERLTQSPNDFLETLAQVLCEIDIISIQQQKVKSEFVKGLKLIGSEMCTYLIGKRLVVLLGMFLTILITASFSTLLIWAYLYLIQGILIFAAIPIISPFYFERLPWAHTIFKQRVITILTVVHFFMFIPSVLKRTFFKIKLHGAY